MRSFLTISALSDGPPFGPNDACRCSVPAASEDGEQGFFFCDAATGVKERTTADEDHEHDSDESKSISMSAEDWGRHTLLVVLGFLLAPEEEPTANPEEVKSSSMAVEDLFLVVIATEDVESDPVWSISIGIED
jgi:hypothetical protein